MKLTCAWCKTEIRGNPHTNEEVRNKNKEPKKNFHGTCFPLYNEERKKQIQQEEMSKRALRLIRGGTWNGA